MATLEEQIRCREMGFPGGGTWCLKTPERDRSPCHRPVFHSSGGGGAAAVRAAGGLLGHWCHHVHPVSAGLGTALGGEGSGLGTGTERTPCSLSGNPPFYEEADEDDYENHDKNLFRKILAGDYEFDPPYWDDISQAGEPQYLGMGGGGSTASLCVPPALTLLTPAKELVTRLMEVEQDQRITAEEAISHEW